MSYNGSGTFVINSAGQPLVPFQRDLSATFNALTADLATGLSTAITKDGQTTTTALITFAAGISSTLVTDATSISTGSLLTSGGLGVTKAAWIGGLINVAGAATLQSTLAVSGTSTMAAINASGTVAMAGAATIGTTLAVTGTSTMAAINASGVGTFTSTGEAVKITPTTATGLGLISFNNTGGTSYIGTDNSTASFFGKNAYGIGINAIAGSSINLIIGSTSVLSAVAAGVTIPGVSTLTGGATIGTGSNVLGFKVGWLTATNTKTSSTALTTLSDLTIAIGAGETWLIEWTLAATANLETTGLSLQVDTPASAVQDIFYEYIPQRLDLVGGIYTTPPMVDFGTASGTLVSWAAADIVYGGKAAINIFVRVTASGAGNVTLGYAQETSSGTALNILRGSRVKAQRTA